MTLPAFKAYDIRGRVPDELNEDLARRIGVALAAQLDQGPVVLGTMCAWRARRCRKRFPPACVPAAVT